MKTKIILVIVLSVFVLITKAQTDTLESSTVGKLLFATNPQKTKVVSSGDEANKIMNSETKDFVLIEDGITIRFLVLSDGRLIRIENEGSMRFYFVSQYYDKSKINSEKLVECFIDEDGKVSEIKTKYRVDSNGKNGFVIADKTVKTMKLSGAVFEYNGAPPISDKDPLVVRYQKIVDETLKLLY